MLGKEKQKTVKRDKNAALGKKKTPLYPFTICKSRTQH